MRKREEIRHNVRYDGHVQGELERRETSKSLARTPRRKVRVRGGEEAAPTDPYTACKGFAIRNDYHSDHECCRWENPLPDVGALWHTLRVCLQLLHSSSPHVPQMTPAGSQVDFLCAYQRPAKFKLNPRTLWSLWE